MGSWFFLDGVEVDGERNYNEVLPWKTRRSMAEDAVLPNSSLILAQERTTRKDPLDHFNIYNGGWNISNQHYIAVISSSILFTFFTSSNLFLFLCGFCFFFYYYYFYIYVLCSKLRSAATILLL
jgi:hypothetical protein